MCMLPKHEDLCPKNPREIRLGSVDVYLSVTLQRCEMETGESLESGRDQLDSVDSLSRHTPKRINSPPQVFVHPSLLRLYSKQQRKITSLGAQKQMNG